MAKKKKSRMQKQVEKDEQQTTQGEQGYLLEVGPEGMEKIRPFVKECAKQQKIRQTAWAKIVDAKENIAAIVHEENLEPAPNGKITFKCDAVEVIVTPQKDKVEVKESKQD